MKQIASSVAYSLDFVTRQWANECSLELGVTVQVNNEQSSFSFV